MASAFGPLLLANLRQSTGSYGLGLHIIAGVMAISIAVPIMIAPPKVRA
jgi:OFA family oxalate/formate antiporter-like MFS transporter